MNGKKIKILFVEPVSDLGGVSVYILSISRYLPRDKYDIHVAASGSGPLFELLKRDNVSVHDSKIDYALISFLQAIFSFRIFLKRERFDIIHAHTAKAGFLCCLANYRLSSKIIYTGHGFRFDQKRNLISKWLFYNFEQFIWNNSNYITILSKTEYDFGVTKGLLNQHKAGIIPMSINIDRFQNVRMEDVKKQKSILGIPYNAFVVGMLGRITFQKDPETFVNAAKIINTRIKNVYFLWVGDGDLKEKTIKLARQSGLINNILFTGQRSTEDIPILLSLMNVVLFSSRFEGLPIAILEAMASKKTIVAAKVGSMKDVIIEDNSGWLFEAGNYKKAASAVIDAYNNEQRCVEVGVNAFNIVSHYYSPQNRISKQFQEVYEKIAGV